MQTKPKHLSVMKPKQRTKLSKPSLQEEVTPYAQINKQIRLLATDNTYYCVYGYN
jgi:hypothetical protein